jgi:predicted RNA binding protein YcfA (HicA-like mRNA interferase family)
MPRSFSGSAVIKILVSCYGFQIASQKGSHVKMSVTIAGKKVITVVPLHQELAHGTLRGILRLAQIEYSDFLKNV